MSLGKGKRVRNSPLTAGIDSGAGRLSTATVSLAVRRFSAEWCRKTENAILA